MECVNDVQAAPKPVGAYSQAVKAGGLVFCAGQVGLDPVNGNIVSGGIEAQTGQVLSNLNAVLEAAGSSRDRILMTTIFLANISDAPKVNALYGDFVNNEAPPARQTVAVKELPLGALIEISLIAEVV